VGDTSKPLAHPHSTYTSLHTPLPIMTGIIERDELRSATKGFIKKPKGRLAWLKLFVFLSFIFVHCHKNPIKNPE
jgi:hypothetical protein